MGAFHSWLVAVIAVVCCAADLTSARTLPPSSFAGDDAASAAEATQTGSMTSSDDVRCDVPGCNYDMLLYCLSNGVIIMGSCSLKKTLCTNGTRNELSVARDGWGVCFQATYNVQLPLEQLVIVHTDNGVSDSQDSNPDHLSSEPEGETAVSQGIEEEEEAVHDAEGNKGGQRVTESQPSQQDRTPSGSDTSQLIADLGVVDHAMAASRPSEPLSRAGGDNPNKPPAGGVSEEEQDTGPLLLERQLLESFGMNEPSAKVTPSRQGQP